jgi:Lon protease-like protein
MGGVDEEKESPRLTPLPSGRLLAAYLLAVNGQSYGQNQSTDSQSSISGENQRQLDDALLHDISDTALPQVDCQVCYNLMLDPVTTYCGHSLCRVCMSRVLDHSLHCPVCRRILALPPSIDRHPNNKTLVDISNVLWPDMLAARREVVTAEEVGVQGILDVPLFVCTLGFPEQPTFLRIFEPRYRLMLRRCIEGSRQFGMLMYNRYNEPQGNLGPVHFFQLGTMLRIIRSQLLPDGTSLIETVGAERFRVTAHGTLDGYSIGNVESIHDVTLAEEERIEADETARPPPADENDVNAQLDRMPTNELLRLGQEFVRRMQARSANWLQQRVLDIHGQPPDDARLFPYWFAAVLPISEDEKYKLLDTRTVRQRLKITATWIRRIESQRW